MNCILCSGSTVLFFQDASTRKKYLKCDLCDLVFMLPTDRLSFPEEKQRYLTHKNSFEDVEYSKYIMPIFEFVLKNMSRQSKGLDYGCGSVPMITHLLNQQGFELSTYDPFFKNEPRALEQFYDYVVSIEVIEHFHYPANEFAQFFKLLKKFGFVAMMSSPLDKKIDFGRWHYRRDLTHVCFYSEKTFQWIKTNFGFTSYEFIAPRTHILRK